MLLYPYRAGSKSVRALAKALPAKKVKLKGSKLVGNKNKTVINWGNGVIDNAQVLKCDIINAPEAVSRAADKREFFRAMEGTGLTPPFCTSLSEAQKMVKKGAVVCRTILQGHSGAGIMLANKASQLVKAPLYVKYIKKSEEFRVHVFRGHVIDIQRKARRRNHPDDAVNWQIRNHSNGFIYAREGVKEWAGKSELTQAAIRTVEKIGLDFGAVDIIYNAEAKRFWVLEVNTAPGLEGTTLEKYAAVFKNMDQLSRKRSKMRLR